MSLHSSCPDFVQNGEYTSLGVIASGGFGIVYKARWKNTRLVAVKEIKNCTNEKYIQREIEIHRNLSDHLNVVRFIDNFEINHKIYIVLEFCDLGTLRNYMNKRGLSMTEEQKVEFMLDAAMGINYLHQNDIVHRDIKPDNMLLSSVVRPVCKISDLGLSRLCTPTARQYDTSQDSHFGSGAGSFLPSASSDATYYLQSCVGSGPYLAPEILLRHYTKTCDVFSFGVVILFTMQNPLSYSDPNMDGHCLHQLSNDNLRKLIDWKSLNTSFKTMLKSMLVIKYNSRISMEKVVTSLQGSITGKGHSRNVYY